MILQALYDYYLRCPNLAPEGFEYKEIPFLIVIDLQGNFIGLEDTREMHDRKLRAKTFLVPKGVGRSGTNSFMFPNIFWDHYGYLLAYPKDETEKALQQAEKQNEYFIRGVREHCSRFPENRWFAAVDLFYRQSYEAVFEDPAWESCKKIAGCNLTFRIQGECLTVAEHPDLAYLSEKQGLSGEGTHESVCLVTGKKSVIATLHTAIALPGAKSGAKLVGFQKNSGYDSYGREQGANAPVGREAEAAYTTALNTLLGKGSRNKFAIGDTTFVYWSGRDNAFEKGIAAVFVPDRDDPDRNVQDISDMLESVYSGRFYDGSDSEFYMLGLSPNAARISVRFWQSGKVKDFAANIAGHFRGLEMVRDENRDKAYFTLFDLLRQMAFEYKLDNLPPNLFASMIRAVLNGTPYPALLQECCLRRIKADRRVGYIRAAVLKAYLNRKTQNNRSLKPIIMALDKENTNPGYLCGRLFAILENIQDCSMRKQGVKLNSTIRDRYYTAASTTPVTVFGRLLGLSNHHLGKLNESGRIYFEKLIGETMAKIPSSGFPRHLDLDDQSRFAIGYYHQRSDLYASKRKSPDDTYVIEPDENIFE